MSYVQKNFQETIANICAKWITYYQLTDACEKDAGQKLCKMSYLH